MFQGQVPSYVNHNMQISPVHMDGSQQQHASQQQASGQGSDMQYMYFTPRDMINFQSSNGKIQKPQQLSFSQAAAMAPLGGPLIFNNTSGGAGNQPNTTQANYFKNMVRLSQQPVISHQTNTSHENRRPTQTSKIANFQAGANQQAFISRQQNNNSPSGPRVAQNHQMMNRSLP